MITDLTTRLMKERVLCLPPTSTQPVFQLTRSSFRWQSDKTFSEQMLDLQNIRYYTNNIITIQQEQLPSWARDSDVGCRHGEASWAFRGRYFHNVLYNISLYIFIMHYIIYMGRHSCVSCKGAMKIYKVYAKAEVCFSFCTHRNWSINLRTCLQG